MKEIYLLAENEIDDQLYWEFNELDDALEIDEIGSQDFVYTHAGLDFMSWLFTAEVAFRDSLEDKFFKQIKEWTNSLQS